MSDAVIFVCAFVGLLILRIVGATAVFLCLLPSGDRCPICDNATLRVQHRGWNSCLPWFRTSWCPSCGWNGLLRFGPLTAHDVAAPTKAGPHDLNS